jgi:hypothetical protein
MKVIAFALLMPLLLATLAFGAVTKVPGGVEFTYHDPSAFSVSLAGTFNNWDAQALAMLKDDEGTWRVVTDLPPGRYEYKFVVNGNDWMADPDNPKVVGDYGNSEIEINEKGEPVIRGVTALVSNTPVNARVMITGWYRGTYSARKDALGDPRWRGSRPRHEMYVSVDPTIGSDVRGSATMRLDTGEGDIREIQADLYSARLAYTSHYFDITGYDNEEILRFNDPMGIVGDANLPGTLWDDHVAFGMGTQGIIGNFRLFGLDTKAFYSNTYDASIYDSNVWFHFEEGAYKTVSRSDNTSTDHVGVRTQRNLLGVNLGGTFLTERNGWWVGFETQEAPPEIEAYRVESHDSASTWFEMGTSQRFISVDASVKPVSDVSVFAEYAWTRYLARWDAGNRVRKQGDVFVDGKIDLPVGDEDGTAFMMGFDLAKGNLNSRFTYESEHHDGMESGEGYVTHYGLPFEDPDSRDLSLYGPGILDYEQYKAVYNNVNDMDTLFIFETRGLPERKLHRGRFEVSGTALGLSLGLDVDIAKREWDYRYDFLKNSNLTETHIRPSVNGSIFGERLTYDVMYEASKDNLHVRMPSPFDRNTLLIRGDVGLIDNWFVYYNLRSVSYEWKQGGASKDKSFFDTHFALGWSPVPRVEIRLGYGVNPVYYIDQSIEGREIGRERWMASYLWLAPGNTLIEAEKALEDVDMIFLMGVIGF